MFYDRKIKYMDVYENGSKVQNAGFVRLEAKEGKVRIQLQISKLRFVDTYECPILLLSSGKEAVIGTLSLEKGRGTAEFVGLSAEDLLEGIGYDALLEVQVRLSAGRVLRGIVREEKPELNQIEERPEQMHLVAAAQGMLQENEEMPENQVIQRNEEVPESQVLQRREGMLEDGVLKENEREKDNFEMREQEDVQKNEKAREYGGGRESEGMRYPMKADKWQQLWNIYPHIRPFDDKREYIVLKPQDFVVLNKDYFTLATNSFLLHGFYNYGHLILTKENHSGAECFYIGVPGNLYYKEKQVAILFGFESFEGKHELAGNGDFGYYMVSVEI